MTHIFPFQSVVAEYMGRAVAHLKPICPVSLPQSNIVAGK